MLVILIVLVFGILLATVCILGVSETEKHLVEMELDMEEEILLREKYEQSKNSN